ncbi:bifunctional precorrin-2 dehydrogenase/sirohydrochlorin ferrochelatase [Paenibacillus sp. YPG26]|uniref:precorrin-2 dehydrogenase/sirohydrochlorin ferrochelatase family protein n=1 Tax=Paenibacillus sp. YPG26 TaxID=2878915 RepID=UPI00203ED9E4|nr:bifunctional precorrin-2 dehydrogenase/sirohydrochlorin ferrochelatase [Paenibacillus sp. YPG26]USB34239.1 bifunctional precorrin-2 dehydrogenase/sirohydrochlorin ferrochelatase [Paenibacillus sp. YPG26]
MIKAEGLRCVVIGGGSVAERKTMQLLKSGADVKLISPSVTGPLHQAAHEGSLIWYNRCFMEGDLEGASLVYSATDQASVNEQVAHEAGRLGVPVNLSGPGLGGTFISPSVVRRGDLVIAVSTSGAGPAAAARISREIDQSYGDEYETYIDFLSSIRSMVKSTVPDGGRRRGLLKAAAEMDILSDIRSGVFQPWSEQQIKAWIKGNISYN